MTGIRWHTGSVGEMDVVGAVGFAGLRDIGVLRGGGRCGCVVIIRYLCIHGLCGDVDYVGYAGVMVMLA